MPRGAATILKCRVQMMQPLPQACQKSCWRILPRCNLKNLKILCIFLNKSHGPLNPFQETRSSSVRFFSGMPGCIFPIYFNPNELSRWLWTPHFETETQATFYQETGSHWFLLRQKPTSGDRTISDPLIYIHFQLCGGFVSNELAFVAHATPSHRNHAEMTVERIMFLWKTIQKPIVSIKVFPGLHYLIGDILRLSRGRA